MTSASNLSGAEFNQSKVILALSLMDQNVGGSGGDGTAGQWNVQFLNPPASGQAPVLTWPVEPGVLPGGSYHVQYKNNLTDPAWQNLNANSTVVGNQGQTTDFSPPGQRFYRVILTY
jgi:hypothetical protein